MKPLDILHGALAEFFRYNKYPLALAELRKSLRANTNYRMHWPEVVEAVLSQRFPEGAALDALVQAANLPLYEDNEAEAYRWLSLMVVNSVAEEGFPILPYNERP